MRGACVYASRRATGEPHSTCQETHGEASIHPKGPRAGPKSPVTASLRPHGSHTIRVAACRLRKSVFLYGRTSFKRLRDCEVALLGVSRAPKMTF
eukprot:scaffold82840_cov35-Phaeocystis_antarctica.AAC.2